MGLYTNNPEQHLEHSENLCNILHLKLHDNRINRPEGWSNEPLPDGVKGIIAAASHLGPSQQDVADTFGISRKAVGALQAGNDSEYQRQNGENPNAALMQKADETKAKITDAALDRLMATFNLLTPDKMVDEKPLPLSQIAKNIASIVEKMGPKEAGNVSIGSVNIYAPVQKDIAEYKVIDVQSRMIE